MTDKQYKEIERETINGLLLKILNDNVRDLISTLNNTSQETNNAITTINNFIEKYNIKHFKNGSK